MNPNKGGGNLSQVSFGSSSRGAEGGDGHRPSAGYHMDRDIDLLDLVPFTRRFALTDIDDGPYHCDVVTCMRIQGFRTQEALERHKRNFH
jgi:hypothetical protein